MSNLPAPPPEEDLFQFPCDFPVKIMGRTHEGFAQEILALVLSHAPDFDAATMELRGSSAGRFVSLTCTIRAQSRLQLDNLYRALTAHPGVVMVL
jgi:putative lipoic acid-binding regulatory protein